MKDGLGRTALDIAGHYRDVMGHDMRQLISTAMEQWMAQTDEADRVASQKAFPPHYEEFKLGPQ